MALLTVLILVAYFLIQLIERLSYDDENELKKVRRQIAEEEKKESASRPVGGGISYNPTVQTTIRGGEKRRGWNSLWWENYRKYLDSSEWRDKRSATLLRDGHRCQKCNVRPATQVHHLSYKRTGKEHSGDLISVRDSCHSALHSRKNVTRRKRL